MNKVEIKTPEQSIEWIKQNQELWATPGIILLNGPMGAGKTQMVRWILSFLGSQEASSPTFAIHHRYDVANRQIDHFDIYRLENALDLDNIGFWDILNEPDNLVLVEWADRLPAEAFRKDKRIVILNIDLHQNGTRTLSWTSS